MAKRTLESLGPAVRSKRGDRKLRETAAEIGVSPATLLRIEEGHVPDVATFGKVCRWLSVDPGEFLGFKQRTEEQGQGLVAVSAHLRAQQHLQPETARALAQMILLACKMQPS